MKLNDLTLREYGSSKSPSHDSSPNSRHSEKTSHPASGSRKGPPVRGTKKCKVPYDVIRREWREMAERGERMNKSALGRKLCLDVSLIRAVLNATGPYPLREQQKKEGSIKKRGLILGFE
jgi:hypothetical protein